MSIGHLCQLFELPSSTYYEMISRPQNSEQETNMINRIMDLSKDVYHTYGTRRMSHILQKEQLKIGRHKTRRLMKAAGINVVFPKRNTVTHLMN